MAQQLSMIPGEDELKKLCEERSELRSKLKPLLDLVKGNSQFLVKYAPFCHDVYFRSDHLKAAIENTAIAGEQARELRDATAKLEDTFDRIYRVEWAIEELKESVNTATNGAFKQEHPELWGISPEQLEAEADEILESEGLDAETGAVAPEPEVDDGENSGFDDGLREDPRTAI